MWGINRIASGLAGVLALVDVLAIYSGEGFLFLFKERQAGILYLFSVAFFMGAGLALMVQHKRVFGMLALLGVLFAARAGLTVPEGGREPWCRPSNPTYDPRCER